MHFCKMSNAVVQEDLSSVKCCFLFDYIDVSTVITDFLRYLQDDEIDAFLWCTVNHHSVISIFECSEWQSYTVASISFGGERRRV